jgi:hypothetical protein
MGIYNMIVHIERFAASLRIDVIWSIVHIVGSIVSPRIGIAPTIVHM